ncbi:glutaredoxin [Cokeromyces recurvatus]|uniref:glutaredoxin n=1 Tax=Cokeromyces recurvatus TaxID=90255 RepID=UPI00221EC8D5|nr:glutaredoxin [Cokeromyces recurvatus]KAI7902024.1 glutaredoxin [Cokeromyces recurvatus]
MSVVSQGIRDFVNKAIKDNKVMIFSKSYCPYCIRAKDLFDDIEVDYKALELNDHKDGEAIQTVLKELTNQNTVPNIFINQHHVGGSDSLRSALKSGKLERLFKEAAINYSKLK